MHALPAPLVADKLARLSRAMEWLTTIGIALVLTLMVLSVFIPSWTRGLLLSRLGETGGRLPLDPTGQILVVLITAVPVGVMIWGLWQVRGLFRDFAHGRVFTTSGALRLRLFGIAVLIQAPLGPITGAAVALALTLRNPPGQRLLVIGLSFNDYLALVVGGVLIAIAAVMAEASRLADENAGFV